MRCQREALVLEALLQPPSRSSTQALQEPAALLHHVARLLEGHAGIFFRVQPLRRGSSLLVTVKGDLAFLPETARYRGHSVDLPLEALGEAGPVVPQGDAHIAELRP